MSSPLRAQPHPDRVFPFDGATVKQPLWISIPQCVFFVVVCIPGALIWAALSRSQRETH